MTAVAARTVSWKYTVQLELADAPPVPMTYTRVKGRQYQPHTALVTYHRRLGQADWSPTVVLSGWILRKDGSLSVQQTSETVWAPLPDWLDALVAEHKP